MLIKHKPHTQELSWQPCLRQEKSWEVAQTPIKREEIMPLYYVHPTELVDWIKQFCMYQRDKVTPTNQSMQEREVHKVVHAFIASIPQYCTSLHTQWTSAHPQWKPWKSIEQTISSNYSGKRNFASKLMHFCIIQCLQWSWATSAI